MHIFIYFNFKWILLIYCLLLTPLNDNDVCRFVWRKKIERDITQGVPIDAYSLKAEKKRQRERMVSYLILNVAHPIELRFKLLEYLKNLFPVCQNCTWTASYFYVHLFLTFKSWNLGNGIRADVYHPRSSGFLFKI